MLQQLPNRGVQIVPPLSGPQVPSCVAVPLVLTQYVAVLPQKPKGEQQSPKPLPTHVTPGGHVPSVDTVWGVTGATHMS